MICNTYTVLAAEGLHARPAKALLNTVKEYQSAVTLKKDGREVDARSMLGILSIQAVYNSQLTVEVVGCDEEQAMSALNHFFTEAILNL